jgi:hypothetical protein
VDDFITFDPLRPEQIRQIVVLRAHKFADRLAGVRPVQCTARAVQCTAQVVQCTARAEVTTGASL